jgi:hypothetical protein
MPKHRPPRRAFTPRTPGQQPGVPHFRIKLRESAVTAERASLIETSLGTVSQSGRMLIQLINEGRGSSGAYAAAVLEEAARNRIFGRGLAIHANHPTAEEEESRPERNVLDWVGQLVEDARYDPVRRALIAEAQIFQPWRGVFLDPDFAAAVGLSIRASGVAEHGTFEGQPALIVKEITEAQSVDFVTKAGRGGKVLALLESARTKLAESPTEQIRVALERAVRAAYGVGEHRYAWIRDFDPDRAVVWFDTDADGDSTQTGTWEQTYATNGIDVALLGPRRQVTAVTVYRPVADVPTEAIAFGESAEPTTADVTDGAPPTGSTTPTTTEEGPDMSGTSTGATASAPAGTAPVVDTAAIQIEAREAATARDKAAAERDTALQEAAAQKDRADNAEAELRRFRAVESARPLVAAQLAEAGLPAAAQAKVTAGVTARVPLTESGQLDQNALRTLVEAEVTAEKTYLAQLAEAAGAGTVTGFGQQAQPAAQTPASWVTPAAEPNAALIEAYRARGLDAKAAEAAARGRAV